MKFSALSLLALPLLGAAAENPMEEYVAQFQGYMDKFMSYIPNPNANNVADAVAAKVGEKRLSVLTLDTWQDTLYSTLKPGQTEPEEWWVLISGRNKTCFGRCGNTDLAFNQTAAKFALLPNSPHMAYINCDEQPVLCNIFSAGPSTLWSIGLKPPGNKVDIWAKRLNGTTITSEELLNIRANQQTNGYDGWHLIEHMFHPFNSFIAENGLSVPVAYTLWVFSVVPNWAVMIFVSFASRRLMTRQQGPQPARG